MLNVVTWHSHEMTQATLTHAVSGSFFKYSTISMCFSTADFSLAAASAVLDVLAAAPVFNNGTTPAPPNINAVGWDAAPAEEPCE
jgi:hypothetical protein